MKPVITRETTPGSTWNLFEKHEGIEIDPDLVTAVSVVVFGDESQSSIYLTKNLRGWEIVAGHKENETPEQAAARESMEETGVAIVNLTLHSYTEITQHGSKPDKPEYPHPISYMLHYFAVADGPAGITTGHEITDSRLVDLKALEALITGGQINETDSALVALAIKAATNKE